MPGLLDDAMKDPKFIEGIKAVEKAQKEHWERMTKKEPKAEKLVPEKPKPEPIPEKPKASKKPDGRVPRFRRIANNMRKQIEEKRRPMTQNPTPKRMREYNSRMHDADNLERSQRALNAIADAIEAGALPDILNDIKTKDQVHTLVRKGLESGGYYDVIPSDKYADTSPKGKALQSLMEGEVSEEQKAKDEERAKQRELEKLEEAVRFTKIPGFFPTPKPVITEMLDRADIKPGMKVLEPSAGKGDIADSIKETHPEAELTTIERMVSLSNILKAKGYEVVGDDFLEHTGEYDRIIQNPPFEKGQDIDHVKHAYEQLKEGGRLISIMSQSPFFRSDKKSMAFREWFADVGGIAEDLPSGAFKG